jgi:hypothetical protein
MDFRRGVHEVHRSRKPSDDEVQRKKDHVWTDTETVEKCSIFSKAKECEKFTRRNT